MRYIYVKLCPGQAEISLLKATFRGGSLLTLLLIQGTGQLAQASLCEKARGTLTQQLLKTKNNSFKKTEVIPWGKNTIQVSV